jgi:hypothetical protein
MGLILGLPDCQPSVSNEMKKKQWVDVDDPPKQKREAIDQWRRKSKFKTKPAGLINHDTDR